MVYENIKDLVRDIRRVLIGEEDIDLQKIDDTIVKLIEKNREINKESRDPYVKEYLKKEYEALENLLVNWRRYVATILLKGEKNKIKFSIGGKMEKLINLINEFLQIDGRGGILGIVKKEIPPFVGSDGKEYGPFAPGDIILINKRDFDKLRERGLIEDLKINV